MKKTPLVPKEVTNQLKLKTPPEKLHYKVSPYFYKKDGNLKYVRIYIPTPLVHELNLKEKSSLELTIGTGKNEEKIITMRVI